MIALASVLSKKAVSSLVREFENAALEAARTGPQPKIPDAFQVTDKNGKPGNGNFVAQRSKVTGKMQWEPYKTPLH